MHAGNLREGFFVGASMMIALVNVEGRALGWLGF